MPQTIKVSTPDHIEFEYQLAGIGSRFAAVALDHLFQFLVYIGIVIVYTGLLFDSVVEVSAFFVVIIFLLIFAYFLLFEWLSGGQSPGKKIMGLRVMYEDGRPIDFGASAIRNVLRIADFLPAFYGLGLTVMFINPKLQRLGDLASGTIVVIERPISRATAISARPKIESQPAAFSLQRQDREAAIRFLERRAELEYQVRRDLAIKIARSIAERANMDVAEALGDPESFLEKVATSE